MKHITLFDTTTQYNNATLDLPNVSLTLDNMEVHYNPYDERLTAKYNITDTSSATTILGDSSNISSIEIDSATLDSIVTSYTFNTIGEHVVKYTLTNNTIIDVNAFQSCYKLTNVTIPSSVTNISNIAFFDCSGLMSVEIPNSVTSIGDYAFCGCSNLTSVTIPNSVTNIGSGVFSMCDGLTSILVASGNSNYDSRNNCNALIETSSNTLIAGCKNTVIPNSVTSISNIAFQNCSGLTSVTIPSNVTSIGSAAFVGCSGLTSIYVDSQNSTFDSRGNCNAIITISDNTLIVGCKNTIIPNSVTSIGDNAFFGCSDLTSMTVPTSVVSIGMTAFFNCSGLTTLTVQATTPPTLGSNALNNTNANLVIKVPLASVNAYKSAPGWSDYASKIQAIS